MDMSGGSGVDRRWLDDAPCSVEPSAAPGRVEQIKVHGKALEGNLEGDSPDRDVTVYLPPSYNTDRTRRYPVVYLLHGYGGTDANWTGRQANVPESADRLAAAGGFHEMIVVMPNAFTLHKGSMYSNSVTTGDWETYIAGDLVSYVDDHYRTLVGRASRGLAGAPMGGYGAVRIAMKRPDVFSSLYILSACCLTANLNPRAEAMAAAEAVSTREAAEKAERGPATNLAFAARGRRIRASRRARRSADSGRQDQVRDRRQVGGQRALAMIDQHPEPEGLSRHRAGHRHQTGSWAQTSNSIKR
jgi:pimeloyl-ACP methyl ester carboxylesterase